MFGAIASAVGSAAKSVGSGIQKGVQAAYKKKKKWQKKKDKFRKKAIMKVFGDYDDTSSSGIDDCMIPNSIILHHSLTMDSGTVSWGAIRRYHMEELFWVDVGYHFGVEQVGLDYEIFVGRMLNEMGAHCKGHNDESIGICFVGNFDNEPPPKVQWDLGVRLVKSLQEVFTIPKDHIYPHSRFAPWKSCPGRKFNVADFKECL